MKLHLEELQMLAAGKRYDELESYLSAMTEAAKPLYNMVGTGNPSVTGYLIICVLRHRTKVLRLKES